MTISVSQPTAPAEGPTAEASGRPDVPAVRFDLTHEPWIPVLDQPGQRHLVGLRELFLHAGRWTGLDLPVPPGESVLLRVLASLTYRLTGLDDPRATADDWQDARAAALMAGRFDPVRVSDYFDTWSHRFDLYDPARPWMQDPRLRTESPPVGTGKLIWGRPSGNGLVWGHHHTATVGTTARVDLAIIHLLTHLGYGPGGRVGARTHGGIATATGKSAPYRSAISYHPVGQTLAQTFLLGLAHPGRYATGHARAFGPDVDPCAWEAPQLPDPATGPGAPTGICDVLTRRFMHAVLLIPDPHDPRCIQNSHVTWGRHLDPVPVTDPYLSYRNDGSGTARDANAGRQVWRDLDALLAGTANRRNPDWDRPDVITDLAGLPTAATAGLPLRVTGYGFDQERGKTINRAWFAASTPPVLSYLADIDPAGYELVADLLAAAEQASRTLWAVLRRAWDDAVAPGAGRDPKAGPGPWADQADALFWTGAQEAFLTALDTPTDQRSQIHPARLMRGVALQIYDQITAAATTPRAVRAIEMNRSRLS